MFFLLRESEVPWMEAAAEKSRSATVLDLQAWTYGSWVHYQLGEPTIRSACSTRTVSVWSAFLMPFLPLFTGIRHLAHVLTVSPTKTWLLCATPAGMDLYWAIQAGLLTPLTFARHRLSPLAAFTSGAYFLHTGRRWQWISEFYSANFKGIFGSP